MDFEILGKHNWGFQYFVENNVHNLEFKNADNEAEKQILDLQIQQQRKEQKDAELEQERERQRQIKEHSFQELRQSVLKQEQKLKAIKKSEKNEDDIHHLIDEVPRLILLDSSNFPSPKSSTRKAGFNFHQTEKPNQSESKTPLDLSHLLSKSKLSHDTPQSISNKLSIINADKLDRLKSKNKLKLRYQGTNRNLNVKLLGINYDSRFGLDEEEDNISKLDFEFARSLLTVSDLEQVLIESPAVVHVSTHGSHHYRAVDKKNEFQISFEETHTLRALIDYDPNYSAYYAVVALLFEMEINHFVQYGFERIHKHKEKQNTSLRTYIWRNEEKFALLMNKKIYAMLKCILDRFGMYYRDNTIAQCIEIFWGQYKYDTATNTPVFVALPHPPMDAYQLKTLYSHDEDVQEILKDINDDYNTAMGVNQTIAKSLKKKQKFSWEILSILLHRKLMDAGAEPVDTDDTQWVKQEDIDSDIKDKEDIDSKEDDMKGLNGKDVAEFEDKKDDMTGITAEDYAEFFGSDDDDDNNITAEDMAEFFGSDDDRTTKVKFGNIMDLTREIKIIPINIDRGDLQNKQEMRELIEKVSLFRERLVKSIKKIPDIRIAFSSKSRTASNIHIIQFSNKWAITDAKKKIEKIRENPKYNHEYDILFRDMSKADESTKIQVGFVKKMQEKVYRIDIKNKTDPISLMMRKHLKSKAKCKIKLLVLNGCHSFILGKIFSEYVENVICIHPFVKIWDSTALTFTRYFYSSLQEYTNPSTPFRQSVLKSYNAAKIYVAKQCVNDNACLSHSHSHNINTDQRNMQWKQQRFNQLHLNEDWNELQNRINDPEQFKKYRLEMQRSGVLLDEPLMDLYDDKTVILHNISKDTMDELREYLKDSNTIPEKKVDDENKDNMDIMDNEDFVQNAIYRKDEHYEEFSVGYLKFKSTSHRRMAIQLLNQKIYDEELEFSDHILFEGGPRKVWKDLGWNHRIVPRCCCSPHHPHIAQDKLILLCDGYIINRELIHNVSQVKTGLKKLKVRRDQRRQRTLKPKVIQSNDNDEINVKIKTTPKRNTVDDDNQNKTNSFESKSVRNTGNNFGTEIIHKKKNTYAFDDDDY